MHISSGEARGTELLKCSLGRARDMAKEAERFCTQSCQQVHHLRANFLDADLMLCVSGDSSELHWDAEQSSNTCL
ncbi:hypothetical protein R3I93_012124 [Phoxinus phoxinus]|uniref:Uncharacterized protein n=1 Tax=Phoxinus phoxinus TaxID=58324 RepID=A0AAN9CVC8_9TELE